MADKKISELVSITGSATAADDFFVVVDTSGAVTHKISREELNNAIEQDVLENISITNLTSDLNTNGNDIKFGDNDKAIFGDAVGGDLQIYHDGSNSYINEQGTGNLKIIGSDISIEGSGETHATFVDDGAVTLYHNNAIKFATTATGVDVTGSVTADGLTVDGKTVVGSSSSNALEIHSNGDTEIAFSYATKGNIYGKIIGDITQASPLGGEIAFQTATGGSLTERMRIDSSGNVGIGTSNPGMLLEVDASGSGANDIARFSGRNSAGLTFRNATSQDFIIHTATSDALIFGTNGNNERMRITSSGNVGIGITTPDAEPRLHVRKGDAGGVDSATNSVLTIENSTTAILQFLTPNTANQQIRFGDPQDTGAGFIQYNHSANAIQFGTNGPEKMRLTSAGKLCVGTTSAVSLAMLTLQPADTNRIINTRSFNTSLQYHHVFQNNSGNLVGGIAVSTSSTAYNTTSDYRLKTDVTYDWDATTRLKQLKPARFEWIIDGDDAVPVDGFLAHEVQDIVPEAISGTKDAVNEDGNPVYQQIDQSKLTPLLTKALIEAVEKIEQLEARITALETN